MSKEQVISSVREEVGKGQTLNALQTLLTFLNSERKYRRLADIARLAQAQFIETEAEVRRGLISNAESDLVFNRVRHTIFNLLDDLDSNNLRPDHYEIEPDTTPKRQLWVLWSILGVLVVGVAAALYFFVFQQDTGTVTPAVKPLADCPVFEPQSDFNIMLLPFRTFRGGDQGTAVSIMQRLRSLAAKYNLNTTPSLFVDVEKARRVVLPPSKVQAEQIARECGSQLIVWGTDEPIGASGEVLINAKYSYIGPTDRFDFTQMVLQDNDVLDTVRMISSIALQGSLTTQPIEQIVLTFFGIAAFNQENYQAVIDELEAGRDTTFIGNMMLADSYLAQGNYDKAIEKYDTVLVRHPNYPLARNNRGVLLYDQKKYVEAIQDFNVKLEMSPQDTSILTARANAYFRTQQLEKAADDYSTVNQLMPENRTILKRIKEVEAAKEIKREQVEEANTSIRLNTNLTESLLQRSDALKSLGQTDQAITDAQQAIRNEPTNPKPYAILIELFYENKQQEELQRVLELAKKNRVTLEKIEEINPQVRDILSGSKRLNFKIAPTTLLKRQ